MKNEPVWVYMTAGCRSEALTLARVLVDERLAACVNVLGEITSVYRWEGRVNEDPEWALAAKTTRERLDALTMRVRELHTYSCPCVVALPIVGGNAGFLSWIAGEVKNASEQ